MKISVLLVTHNSSLYLTQVLECVKDFDDIVVCDLGSTDSTLDIAAAFGCNVVSYTLEDGETIEDVYNFSLQNARHEWVLMIEPNELVSPALKEYLYEFADRNEGDGLFLPRKNYLMYQFRKSSYPDYQLRMSRRSKTFWDRNLGPLAQVEGELKTIPASRQDLALVHLSTRFHRYMDSQGRSNRLDLLSSGTRKVSLPMMLFSPMWTFLETYFIRGTVFYGKDGFVFACSNATDHFSRLAEIHENRRIAAFNQEHTGTGIHLTPVEK